VVNKAQTNRHGFTLTEVSIASSILVIAIAMAMAGLGYTLRSARMSNVQSELDIDVQTAMERIKIDVRLTSQDEMFFYPEGAWSYSAMTFPMARDDDDDGAVDLDAEGHIVWDKTVVYHVWSGQPSQLRMTIFDPRDGTLTQVERQDQLNSVALNGNGSSTHNSENATTMVVFENLFSWSIQPRGSTYDGYAPAVRRDLNVTLGSCVLGSGSQTFEFTVTGTNASSSGFKIGLDSLIVSPSMGPREAEAQLPATAYSNVEPVEVYMSAGSWSGNYHLSCPATAVGDCFTLTMDNDCWEETNFRWTGDTSEDTTVVFDQTLSPYDYVVSLDDIGYCWYAREQTGDSSGVDCSPDEFSDTAVRAVIRGEETAGGGWINHNGGIRTYVLFAAGATAGQNLIINSAYIAECLDPTNASMDAATGTERQLNFFGSWTTEISGGGYDFAYADFSIDKEKNYLVSFKVDGGASKGNARKWREILNPAYEDCYMIAGTNNPDVSAAVWSTRGDVISSNLIVGVYGLYVTYPTNGIYTTRAYDTHMTAPGYTEMDWNADVPSGCGLSMKVRTGSSNDMSDATAWSNVTAITSPGTINPGDYRYVQFQAQLNPNSSGFSTPKLQDVTIKWPGPEQFVDIGGTFTKGPDYGIFELRVDDELLVTGLNIDLEIFKDCLGHLGMTRLTSALTAEVTPRNTGR